MFRNKNHARIGSIFSMAFLFNACLVLFVFHQNDWFGLKNPSVQEEKPEEEKKDVREEKDREGVLRTGMAINKKIYLPNQSMSGERKKQVIKEMQKKHEMQEEDVSNDIPPEASDHSGDFEQEMLSEKDPLPEREEQEKVAAPVKPEIQPEIRQEGVSRNEKKETAVKHASLPEKSETVKANVERENEFDFDKYKANLLRSHSKRKGEKLPLLLIDDHNKKELYKKGLGFYGYQMIARPEVRPGKPYYFVVNNHEMIRIDEKCPYTGLFPSVLQEDRNHFLRLLTETQLAEISNRTYELFYAPLDLEMPILLESKLKWILEEYRLASDEVSQVTGTFRETGGSYILIIETIVTAKGKVINIDDPDNRITTAGRY